MEKPIAENGVGAEDEFDAALHAEASADRDTATPTMKSRKPTLPPPPRQTPGFWPIWSLVGGTAVFQRLEKC